MRKFVFIINLFAFFLGILLPSCKQEQAKATNNTQTTESIKQLRDSVEPNVDSSMQVIVSREPQKEVGLTSIHSKPDVEDPAKSKETKANKKAIPCFDYEIKDYDTTKYVLFRHSSTEWCLSDRLIFYSEPKSYDKAHYILRHIGDKWYLLAKNNEKPYIHTHKTKTVNDTVRLINGNEKIGGKKE